MKTPTLLLRIAVLSLFVTLIAGFIGYRTNKLASYLYPPKSREILLANSVGTENFYTDTPTTSNLTPEQQQRQWLLDSLYEHDSVFKVNTLRAMSSKTVILPIQDYFKKVHTYIDTVIEKQKKNAYIQTNSTKSELQKSDTLKSDK